MFFERARVAHPCEKEERGRRTVRAIIFDDGYLISDLMQKRKSRVDLPFLAWRRFVLLIIVRVVRAWRGFG